jgi:hypothetical protein
MADRCQATAASGNPCSATPRPGRPYCLWHDPQAEGLRRDLSRKGGAARSNRAKARKQMTDAALAPAELQGLIGATIRSVLAGKKSPGIGQAIASLARAAIAIREATEWEERLTRLEAAAGVADRRRA